jgi:hypothetical protein
MVWLRAGDDAMAAADRLSVQVMPRRQGPVPPMPMLDRVDALLAETTVGNKIAQLGSRWVGNCLGHVAEGGDGQAEGCKWRFRWMCSRESGSLPPAEATRHGLGHLTRVYGSRR